MPLSFQASTSPPTPLPLRINRSFIQSPQGPLELLYALPEASIAKITPFFFVHGGFGCAAVWLEYMTLLSAAPYNIPCYAISLRGHGASWTPGYFRMTFGTNKRMLADDIVTGVKHVEEIHQQERGPECKVVLVAHSNGGGLAQLALNGGDIGVSKLALLDATPPFGLFGVYWNWLKADQWFPIRVYWHLLHPRSPLSSSSLVKNAFFCDEYPIERVSAFEKLMSPFESLIWPSSIMSRFVSVKKILQHVSVFLDRPAVLIMAAEKSRLMGVPMMRSMADEYAVGVRDILLQQGEDASSSQVAQAVSFEVVSRVGHHLQNDLNWREGAEKLAKFYQGNTA
ncbi:Actin-related protein 2 [Elsinoe australis]|uniref:Actin-related protein 2 n=1 Tax=Elsinoe australis TaxID=40998 RepID=A0A2P8A0J7_9PEZI|nr:Actin-related protein 2 [Elsinoe australis]